MSELRGWEFGQQGRAAGQQHAGRSRRAQPEKAHQNACCPSTRPPTHPPTHPLPAHRFCMTMTAPCRMAHHRKVCTDRATDGESTGSDSMSMAVPMDQ